MAAGAERSASFRFAPMVAFTVLGTTLFLAAANWAVVTREAHLANGRTILIEVTQFDPRSLMQGDYQALAFPICQEIDGALPEDTRGEGLVVVQVDANDIGRFVRLHDEARALAADEHLLRYKIRHGRRDRVRVCAEEFFFQEGLAEAFARARFAEIKVTPEGRTLLVALRDAERLRIGAPR